MKKFKDTINKLSPFIKPYKIGFIVAIFLIIVAAVINAVAPMTEGLITTQLTKDIADINKGIEGAAINFKYILKILAILACLYVGSVVSTISANFLLTNAIQNLIRDLRNAVQNKIRKLPVSYFDRNSYGDVLSRVTNDIDTISNALQQSFSQVINSILSLTLALAMMFTINIKMALLAFFIIPISFLVSKFIVGKSQKYFNGQQNALGNLNGKVQEFYTGFNEIKLYGKEEKVIEEFKNINEELYNTGFKAQFISSTMSPLVSLVSYIGIGGIGALGAIFVLGGKITVGNLQAFIRYIWQVNQPLSQVTQLSSTIQSAVAAIKINL